jgi:hypothetical protein
MDENGGVIAATYGRSYRGSDEIVQRAPGNFVDGATADSELPSPAASIAAIPVPDWAAERLKREVPVADPVVAVSGFTAAEAAGRSRNITAGQILDRNDPIVKENPAFFQVPARSLATEETG